MNQPGFQPTGVLERDASAWQGTHHEYPESDIGHAAIDLPLHAWLGQFTGNVSPAALAMAWVDWSSHLLLSPDKQAELAIHAASATLRWLQYCAGAAVSSPAEPVTPLAQDKRFTDPDWHRWPYNVLNQGFLLQQQWWHRATHRACEKNSRARRIVEDSTLVRRDECNAAMEEFFTGS